MELVLDTGSNETLLDRDFVSQAGIEIDKSTRFDIVVANGPTFTTEGRTKTPVPSQIIDVDGATGTLAFSGQSATLSHEGGSARKALIDVMGTVVSRLGFIVILMKNKNGGDGHFMISPESNHVYPIDLNADRLPIIRRAGVTSARPSAPDTLWEVVKRLSNVATARDRRLSAKSSQAEAFLHSALSESASQATYTPHAYMATAVAHAASGALPDTDTSSSDGSDLESEPEVSSEEAAHMRLAAMKASRKNHKWPDAKPKSRARTAPVVHTGESAHRLLHRSADVTHQTLAQPEVRIARDGKTISGDKASKADFDHQPCSVCKQTRMLAPSRRKSAMCRECAHHSE